MFVWLARGHACLPVCWPAMLCLHLYLAGIQLTLTSKTSRDKWSLSAEQTSGDLLIILIVFFSYSNKIVPKQQRSLRIPEITDSTCTSCYLLTSSSVWEDAWTNMWSCFHMRCYDYSAVASLCAHKSWKSDSDLQDKIEGSNIRHDFHCQYTSQSRRVNFLVT